ncbi:MAG: hypothetical protein BGO70_11290 [Bacteroidetes bacterium 43-93]|nr:T9SS type A sorting domain-containing protein [Bacteroidota bacterium]OJW95691.1 MAG: hypothetical protein BGO70_11290 [Bacteroidetes bacterium 43-93]
MKTTTFLLLLILLCTNQSYSQAPYLFSDYPINDPGVIQDSDPKNFCVYNNRLFFCAYGGRYGDELWSTDGTTAGTCMVKDINVNGPGSYGFGSLPAGFTEINGKLIFSANSDSTGRELWITDGTTAGTYLLKDIYAGIGHSNPNNYTKLGNKIIFTAQTVSTGTELWVTDGTTNGTQLLKDIYSGAQSSSASFFTSLNGKVYFQANDGINGAELWATDGTASGTKMLLDISTGPGSSSPSSLTELSGKIYFYAATMQYGSELWISDGTPSGTHIVKDIYPGYKSSLESISVNPLPTKLAVLNSRLYFSALDSAHGYELWCSDGTDTGTYMVKDINPGAGNSYSVNQYIVYKGKLFFSAFDDTYGKELWVTDGTATGTQLVTDLVPGITGSVPSCFAIYQNLLFYKARQSITDQFDFQMVQTDGTATGTKVITYPTIARSRPLENTWEFIVYDSTLYFGASYDNHGNELWSLKDTTGIYRPTPSISSDIYFSAYPNPSMGSIYLESNDSNFIGSMIQVYDIEGKKIYDHVPDALKTKIDISGLHQGHYFIKLRMNSKLYTKEVILNPGY